jgi:HPt (histidine-containing phosphotransfer) domain-containing protein
LYNKIIGLVKKPVDKTYKTPAADEPTGIKKTRSTDLAYLINITKYDHKLMMEMIALYLEQTPPLIKAIKQSMQDEDWDSLHAAAHKMIPSFSIMGIHKDFETMAKKIQEYKGKKTEAKEIQNLVLQLENVCAQACKELEEEYTILKNTIG